MLRRQTTLGSIGMLRRQLSRDDAEKNIMMMTQTINFVSDLRHIMVIFEIFRPKYPHE